MKKRRAHADDAPELGDEFFSRATRIGDGPAALTAAIKSEFQKRRGRGKQKAPTKVLISLRLSRGTIEAYRHTGPGWQARIDTDLASAAKRRRTGAGRSGAATPTTGELMKAIRRSHEELTGKSERARPPHATRKAKSA
jgi:uncharacterized protein (DUF4415 family)